jgi:antitoxin (DNA-binding transcriptional repressor) of toxin-antitoxin stability system
MTAINMFEAKSTLSKLVADLEAKAATGFLIARNGKPVAKLVALSGADTTKRIGAAQGAFVIPDDIDADNAAVAQLFLASR